MHAIRIPVAVILGGLFTSSMFWLLWSLVGTAFDIGDRAEATRIEFSRMRRDTEVATKRDEKVERERPPPTPETPRLAFSAGGIENNGFAKVWAAGRDSDNRYPNPTSPGSGPLTDGKPLLVGWSRTSWPA